MAKATTKSGATYSKKTGLRNPKGKLLSIEEGRMSILDMDISAVEKFKSAGKEFIVKRSYYDSTAQKKEILQAQTLTCLITAVSDTKVTVEALIDKRNKITQTRSFDILPLKRVVSCKEGEIFNLSIITKPGSREFIYTPGNPDDIKYFEETLVDTTSLQNDLENDPVYNQGPILNDDGDSF